MINVHRVGADTGRYGTEPAVLSTLSVVIGPYPPGVVQPPTVAHATSARRPAVPTGLSLIVSAVADAARVHPASLRRVTGPAYRTDRAYPAQKGKV